MGAPSINLVTRHCRLCKTVLHRGAVRCHACGAFQNHRAWVNLLNDYLSPFGTTVALLGIAIALLIDAFTPDPPSLSGVFFDRGEGLAFAFENKGQSAAILLSVSTSFPYKEGRRWRGSAQTIRHIQDRIVQPSEAVEFRFFEPGGFRGSEEDIGLPSLETDTLDGFEDSELCTFNFVFGDMKDNTYDIQVPLSCVQYAVAIMEARDV